MLNQKSRMPERRAVSPVQARWLDRWGASALFVFAMVVCAASFVRYVSHSPDARPKSHMKTRAKQTVDVFSLHRAPTVAAGDFRYAVLGYGQDSLTGEQIVWLRSITTNRVGGFKEGQRLFQGPVTVSAIESERLVLAYQGEEYEAPILP